MLKISLVVFLKSTQHRLQIIIAVCCFPVHYEREKKRMRRDPETKYNELDRGHTGENARIKRAIREKSDYLSSLVIRLTKVASRFVTSYDGVISA